jgi:hypothetical protein
LPVKNAGIGDDIIVYKPPPKRKIAYAIIIVEITKDEGLVVEILLSHRLSENDVDAVRFLIFFDISCSLVVY